MLNESAKESTVDTVEFIDSHSQLHTFLQRHATARTAVMLDTEFVRVSTYYPELCLIQLRIDLDIILLDTLAVTDLSALWPWLIQQEYVVMHSASQDLEILRQAGCPRLNNLFDTQLAAQLIGYAHQIGYARLVQQVLNVELDKGLSRFDWRTRPLPANTLQYAADDVRYLPAIFMHLQNELNTLERCTWATEEFQHQLNADEDATPDDQQWRRIKGMSKLPADAQARGKALATWREATARERNKPRGWIMHDNDLLEVATSGNYELFRQKISKQARNQPAASLKAVVNQSETLPANELLIDLKPLNLAEKSTFADLKQQVSAAAATLDIEPSIIANRKMLEQWARGNKPAKLNNGWRTTIL